MNTDSLIVYIKKKKDIYKDITKDLENRFDTSNSKLDWAIHKRKQ